MTPQERKVMELALEALEICEKDGYIPVRLTRESITTIKEALAQPAVAEQHKQSTTCGEPVALYANIPTFYVRDVNGAYVEDSPLKYYTTPPQRKPLTDEQLLTVYLRANGLEFYKSFARGIEAAHDIKE